MRNLRRNCQKIYYSLYLGNEMKVDSNGNKTGTYIAKYSDPIACYVSVSPSQGSSGIMDFGSFSDYDKAMTTTEDLPIKELTRLWVEDLDTSKPHDYEVVKVAKGLEQHRYAIRKVTVKRAEQL